MIDLHSHILPGIDDGPTTIEGSLALARGAVAAGTTVMVATPHIDQGFGVAPATVPAMVGVLNARLAEESIPLDVRPGGEIDLTRLIDLDEDELARVSLGGGPYLLLESPFSPAAGHFEPVILAMRERGHQVLLAHPERCPAFQREPDRLAELVDAGVLTQVTAGSMAGEFGETVRRFTGGLLREGLVHVVASDCHDHSQRPPGQAVGFGRMERDVPGIAAWRPWLTDFVPGAILDGGPIPPRPALQPGRGGLWQRFVGRG